MCLRNFHAAKMITCLCCRREVLTTVSMQKFITIHYILMYKGGTTLCHAMVLTPTSKLFVMLLPSHTPVHCFSCYGPHTQLYIVCHTMALTPTSTLFVMLWSSHPPLNCLSCYDPHTHRYIVFHAMALTPNSTLFVILWPSHPPLHCLSCYGPHTQL